MNAKWVCDRCGQVTESYTEQPHLRKEIVPTRENMENAHNLCYGRFQQMRDDE